MSSNLGSCDHCYHVSGLRTEDAVVRDPGRERHVGSQLPEPVARTHSINGTSLNPPPQALGMREVERFLEAPCKGRDRVESKGLLHRGTPLSTLGALSKETALWAGPGSHHLARGTGIVVPSSPKGSVQAGGRGRGGGDSPPSSAKLRSASQPHYPNQEAQGTAILRSCLPAGRIHLSQYMCFRLNPVVRQTPSLLLLLFLLLPEP